MRKKLHLGFSVSLTEKKKQDKQQITKIRRKTTAYCLKET